MNLFALGSACLSLPMADPIVLGRGVGDGDTFRAEARRPAKGWGFEGSGRDSELAKDLMVEEFGLPRATLVIVFEGDNLSAERGIPRAEDEALEPLRNMEDIRSVTTYADTKDQRFLSEDGSKTYALVGFDVSVAETQSLVDEVRRKVRSDELTTYVTGPSAVYLDITNASAEDIRRAEKYAFAGAGYPGDRLRDAGGGRDPGPDRGVSVLRPWRRSTFWPVSTTCRSTC